MPERTTLLWEEVYPSLSIASLCLICEYAQVCGCLLLWRKPKSKQRLPWPFSLIAPSLRRKHLPPSPSPWLIPHSFVCLFVRECAFVLESVLLCVDFLCDSHLAMEISVLPSTLWWRRVFLNNNGKASSKNWASLTSRNLEFVVYTTILPDSFHVFFITTMLRCRKNQCYFYCTMALCVCRLLPSFRERR